jgi:alginate O-acetyltransferase complex protein AlgI
MLFNSYEFVFAFLPLVLLGFYLLGHWGQKRAAITWLVLASLFFYGWWNPPYLILLISSIVWNFVLGGWLSKTREDAISYRKVVLGAGAGLFNALDLK